MIRCRQNSSGRAGGIHKITRGFRGPREINTVTYDPGRVTPEEMIAALKTAGTYIGMVEQAIEFSGTPIDLKTVVIGIDGKIAQRA